MRISTGLLCAYRLPSYAHIIESLIYRLLHIAKVLIPGKIIKNIVNTKNHGAKRENTGIIWENTGIGKAFKGYIFAL